MPRPKAIRAFRSTSRPKATTMGSYRCRTAARWAWTAPRCLPTPIVIILKSPDSISPTKSVCGLTRFRMPIQSASAA